MLTDVLEQLLKKIDWLNAVVIPLIMAGTIGILLSIYTAFLASRIIAFRELLGEAMRENVSLPIAVVSDDAGGISD